MIFRNQKKGEPGFNFTLLVIFFLSSLTAWSMPIRMGYQQNQEQNAEQTTTQDSSYFEYFEYRDPSSRLPRYSDPPSTAHPRANEQILYREEVTHRWEQPRPVDPQFISRPEMPMPSNLAGPGSSQDPPRPLNTPNSSSHPSLSHLGPIPHFGHQPNLNFDLPPSSHHAGPLFQPQNFSVIPGFDFQVNPVSSVGLSTFAANITSLVNNDSGKALDRSEKAFRERLANQRQAFDNDLERMRVENEKQRTESLQNYQRQLEAQTQENIQRARETSELQLRQNRGNSPQTTRPLAFDFDDFFESLPPVQPSSGLEETRAEPTQENIHFAQSQLEDINHQVTQATESLSRIGPQMQETTANYVADQILLSQEMAQSAVNLAQSGAPIQGVRLLSHFARDTLVSVNQFLTGFSNGLYQGFLTPAQIAQAIYNNPTLITNLSNNLMNVLTTNPSAIAGMVSRGFHHVIDSFYQFELTMAYGTAEQRGFALGELGANVLMTMAGEEVFVVARGSMEAVAASLIGSDATMALGSAVRQNIRNSEVLAPEVARIEREIIGIADSARRHGIVLNTSQNATVIDRVLVETLERRGDFTSAYKLSQDQAIDIGRRWVGEGYREIGSRPNSGVFESADGLRRYRIDNSSIQGRHRPNVPHIHLEEYARPGDVDYIANNHIPFGD